MLCQKVSWCYVMAVCNRECSRDLCVCVGFAWWCCDRDRPSLDCPGSTMCYLVPGAVQGYSSALRKSRVERWKDDYLQTCMLINR